VVLDAILLFLGDTISVKSPNRDIAIIPKMKPHDALFKKDDQEVCSAGQQAADVTYGVDLSTL
jgi:hypothetical protein